MMTKKKMTDGEDYLLTPAGECQIGTPESDPLAYSDEFPPHTFTIPYDYWIARFPVTNRLFGQFVGAVAFLSQAEKQGWAYAFNPQAMEWEKVEGANWQRPRGPKVETGDQGDHPVVSVSFFDALAYLDWLNEELGAGLPDGYRFGLPTEAEWEKVARALDYRRYPWGDAFDPGLCCCRFSAHGIGTQPVGSFSPAGDSAAGCADLAGNVWEWTTTLWGPNKDEPMFVYPYDPNDGREDQTAGRDYYRIIRGGSFKDDERGVRSACRDLDPPTWALNNLGFRVFVVPQR
jgi:sulfatase modifying factor 1